MSIHTALPELAGLTEPTSKRREGKGRAWEERERMGGKGKGKRMKRNERRGGKEEREKEGGNETREERVGKGKRTLS